MYMFTKDWGFPFICLVKKLQSRYVHQLLLFSCLLFIIWTMFSAPKSQHIQHHMVHATFCQC